MLLFTRTAAANLKYDMNVKFFCEENNDNNKYTLIYNELDYYF